MYTTYIQHVYTIYTPCIQHIYNIYTTYIRKTRTVSEITKGPTHSTLIIMKCECNHKGPTHSTLIIMNCE